MNISDKKLNKDSVKLEIRNLNVFFGEKHALQNINLKIRPNSITAFIGPSGCGKSTCLKSINRMNDLVESCKIEGEVLINSKNIYSPKFNLTSLRKNAGMVFQSPNPFPMSVFDNVAYGPRIHGIRNKTELAKIVENSLKQAAIWDELKDHLKQSALQLSGGQQQRLCIARALAVKPEILLMDEPTSALDPVSTHKIEDLILNLKQTYTVIIVTHNMQQTTRIADNTAFFLKGKLIEFAPTETLFTNPKDIRTENYITGRNC